MKNIVNNFTNDLEAKKQANSTDMEIIKTLQSGKSFLVEAGAGAGKTYSLKKVIGWIQDNKSREYEREKKEVICITYTNVAVEEITSRLPGNSFVFPSTIHSFVWKAINQYQSTIIEFIKEQESLQAKGEDLSKISTVSYDLGRRYIENETLHLYHEDVLKLFALFLEKPKFRRLFSNKYPIILIDEYQDSYKPIIEGFLTHFISKGKGPQFGFFGDAWQTIYQSNNACGSIKDENLVIINKGVNFRSAPRIVELLNHIRKDLQQKSDIDGFEGEVLVITCEDYTGERRTDAQFRGDLPVNELKMRLDRVREHFKKKIQSSDESLKTLMITHKVLANQQGYSDLNEILGKGFQNEEDPFLLFFMRTVEPLYKALEDKDMRKLSEVLGINRFIIKRKSDKRKWSELERSLAETRENKSIDVLDAVISSKLVPIPPQIETFYQKYSENADCEYRTDYKHKNGVLIKEVLDLDYSQFRSAIDFLNPESEFSTEHGVKGEGYDNVIFVIGRGWNQYQFEKYAPMIDDPSAIPWGKEDSYERNRNLFYVCCSRAKKRLLFFITVPIDEQFRAFLKKLVGEKNILTYREYMDKL